MARGGPRASSRRARDLRWARRCAPSGRQTFAASLGTVVYRDVEQSRVGKKTEELVVEARLIGVGRFAPSPRLGNRARYARRAPSLSRSQRGRRRLGR